MRYIRCGACVGFIVLVALALGGVCGGRFVGEDVYGTLEDGGVFQLPDGGTLFGPGSACDAFNVDAFVHVPFGDDDAESFVLGLCSVVVCFLSNWMQINTNSTCNAWVDTIGLPYGLVIVCGGDDK